MRASTGPGKAPAINERVRSCNRTSHACRGDRHGCRCVLCARRRGGGDAAWCFVFVRLLRSGLTYRARGRSPTGGCRSDLVLEVVVLVGDVLELSLKFLGSLIELASGVGEIGLLGNQFCPQACQSSLVRCSSTKAVASRQRSAREQMPASTDPQSSRLSRELPTSRVRPNDRCFAPAPA
jgi:hypothetical protein